MREPKSLVLPLHHGVVESRAAVLMAVASDGIVRAPCRCARVETRAERARAQSPWIQVAAHCVHATALSGNQMASSRAALSGLSLPWTRLFEREMP